MLPTSVIVAAVASEKESTGVTITTEPPQGPFRTGQRVQFSCSIHPRPREDLTYRWRIVEHVHRGVIQYQQHLNRLYNNSHLHYCYYHCEVLANHITVGSTSRIVEVLGELLDDFDIRYH